MFDANLNYNSKVLINNQEILGIDSINISYSQESNILKPLGYSKGITSQEGDTKKTVSISRNLIYKDPILNYTGVSKIYGSIMYGENNDKYYTFENAYLTEYMVNCAVGSIPKVTCNFSVFGDVSSEDLLLNSGFQLIYGSYTWDEAVIDAQKRGGRLAILNTEDKNNEVPPYDQSMWIGGSDANLEGIWKWIDGSLIDDEGSYSNWDTDEPDNEFGDQNYLQRYSNGKWDDASDLWQKTTSGYVIEYPSSNPPPIFIPNQGSITINCDHSSTNRVVGFDYSLKINRKPIYGIGYFYDLNAERKLGPIRVETLPPIEYSASVQIELDEDLISNSSNFVYSKEDKNINISIAGRNGDVLQSINIPKASLISQELSSSADGVLKLTLNYNGHL